MLVCIFSWGIYISCFTWHLLIGLIVDIAVEIFVAVGPWSLGDLDSLLWRLFNGVRFACEYSARGVWKRCHPTLSLLSVSADVSPSIAGIIPFYFLYYLSCSISGYLIFVLIVIYIILSYLLYYDGTLDPCCDLRGCWEIAPETPQMGVGRC